MNWIKNKKGISLPEVLIAIGVFVLIAGGVILLVTDAYDLSRFSRERNKAQTIAEEGMEATESISKRAWNELVYGNHGLDDTAGYWRFSGVDDVVAVSGDRDYTRIINVGEVYRDLNGQIVETGGNLDLATKKVTVTVSWLYDSGRPNEIVLEKYLTIWDSDAWIEDTDMEFSDGENLNTVISSSVSDNGHVQLKGFMYDYIESAVGLWHLDQGDGTVAYDRSGKGNNGNITGATWADPGKYDAALDFNGPGSYVQVPDNPSLNPSKAITVEAWVNFDVLEDFWLVEKHTSTPDDYTRGYVLRADVPSNAIIWQVGNGSEYSNVQTADNTISTGQWYHIAATYDGAKAKVYVDGQLQGEEDFEGDIDYTNVGDLFIGSSSQNTLNLDGKMDEVAVYNRVLTSSEILDHFESGILENRLRMHFDEGTGENAEDSSAYNNAGLLRNYTTGLTMEAGEVSTDSSWTTVNLTNTYTDPVVVAQVYENNSTNSPFSVRVRNVTANSFEVKLDYPPDSYVPTSYVAEDIYYMVIEEGSWTMPDGTQIEGHKFDTDVVASANNGWDGPHQVQQSYSHSYTGAPVVLTQVMTNNDADWITSWSSDHGNRNGTPTNNSIQIALNGAEVTDSHGSETIGWVAVQTNKLGEIDGVDYETQLTGRITEGHDNGCYDYSFGNTYADPPIVLANQLAMDGNDGSWAVICKNNTTELGVHIEEDQTNDEERFHDAEDVGFIAFSGPFSLDNYFQAWQAGKFGNALHFDGIDDFVYILDPSFSGLKMDVGEMTTDANWTTVNLDYDFDNPVIFTQMYNQHNNNSPASLRVRNVTTNSFEVKLDYPPDNSPPGSNHWDHVYYMALEEGFYTLGDGTKLEAHKFDTDVVASAGNGWGASQQVQQAYENTYAEAPVVATQVQTDNDSDWITSWTSEYTHEENQPNTSSIQVGLNGAEVTDTHGSETVGWMAMENNKTGTIETVNYETQITPQNVMGYDSGCTTYAFNNSYSSPPVVIGQQLGMNEIDGSWSTVCSPLSSTHVGYYLSEDQNNDGERAHVGERVGFAAFSDPFEVSGVSGKSHIALKDRGSVSAWIYREGDSGDWENILGKYQNFGTDWDYGLAIDPSDKIEFIVTPDGDWNNRVSVASDHSIETGKWYYVTGVFDGSNIKIFVNGVKDAADVVFQNNINVTSKPIQASDEIYTFEGLMDELQIYNRGLIDEQVYGLFKRNIDLVGDWHFNNSTDDSSGWNNNGSLIGGLGYSSSGKYKEALALDGVDDYMNVPNDYSLNLVDTGSVELWFKTTADWTSSPTDQYLIGKEGNNGFGAYLASASGEEGKLKFFLRDGAGQAYTVTSDNRLSDTQWHHFVGIYGDKGMKIYIDGNLQTGSETYNGNWTDNVSALKIGNDFEGQIDEVKLWSNIMSAEEVLNSYSNNLAGWWRLADNINSTTLDNSPYGNNGALQPAANAPTWRRGKLGSGLYFDGSDDRVRITNDENLNPREEISLEAWINFSGNGGLQNILTNGSSNRALRVGGADYDSPNVVIFQLNVDGTDHTLTSGEISAWGDWHHVAGTYDGSNIRLYVDGFEVASEEAEGEVADGTGDTFIGSENDSGFFYEGLIDEARVYSTGLTSSEVVNNYLLGLYAAYPAQGVYTSNKYDTGGTSAFNIINWMTNESESHDLRAQMKASYDELGLDGAVWYGAAGADTYFNDPEEATISTDLNGNRWMQYRATFDSDGSSTPEMYLMNINYTLQ
ncbi:hypothetical protein KKF29_02990 [Patescibacteria group bacterium]|nr:hypothetical protein [Patescibacteria group bacterium]